MASSVISLMWGGQQKSGSKTGDSAAGQEGAEWAASVGGSVLRTRSSFSASLSPFLFFFFPKDWEKVTVTEGGI